MKGWIIYDRKAYKVEGNSYENSRFLENAKEMNIELEILKPDQFDLIVTREDKKSILVNDQPTSLPDFIIPRMGAGTTYFALAVIRHLERLGIFSVNSAESIEIVKDKLYSQQILAQYDLPVPKTMLLKFPVDVELVAKHLGFPVIVKMLSGSQGSGVFLAHTKTQFLDLMHIIENANKNANIILQEFIESSHGKDLRVFTVGGRVIGCMKRESSTGDFKANFSAGGTVEEFPLNSEIEWLATQTSKLLNLDVAGIDLLFDGDHYKICEANSAPGFKGFESCINVNAASEIFNFIKLRTGMMD